MRNLANQQFQDECTNSMLTSSSQSSRSLPTKIKFKHGSHTQIYKTKPINKKNTKSMTRTINHKNYDQSINSESTMGKSGNIKQDVVYQQVTSNISIPSAIIRSMSLTHSERFKQLLKFFEKQMDQYYEQIKDEEIQKFRNLLCGDNLPVLLKQYKDECSTVSVTDIYRYLDLIQEIVANNNQYQIILNNDDLKKYCCIKEQGKLTMIQIRSLESELLQKRQQFMQKWNKIEEQYFNETNKSKKIKSQLKKQSIFIYHILKQSQMKLIQSVNHIEEKIMEENQKLKSQNLVSQQYKDDCIQKYHEILIAKLIQKTVNETFNNKNYLAFFQQLELIEAEDNTKKITAISSNLYKKQFKKYLNKNSKKNQNYSLPTACLGCLSYYSEQHNKLIRCQSCYSRFHQTCFQGLIQIIVTQDQQDQDMKYTCQNCLDSHQKKNKKIQFPQCNFCGSSGLLSMKISDGRIHVFCALMNNLWEIHNNKIAISHYTFSQFSHLKPNKSCQLCNCNNNNNINFCIYCKKKAHYSCAYLEGWEFKIQNKLSRKNIQISLSCCSPGKGSQKISKGRRFIINHKNYLFSSKVLM